MGPWKAVTSLIMFIASASSTSAQTTSSDWTELRRRLAQNLGMESFLAKYPDKDHRPAEQISLRKTDAAGSNQMHLPKPARLSLDRQEVVRRAACSEGVPPDIALAIIEHESGFDNSARGAAGEIGACQIFPATVELFEFDRERLRSDYEYNVRSGVKIMRFLLAHFPTDDAIRAYNGGLGFQDSSDEAHRKIEIYFANIDRLRRKYERVRCM